MAGTVKHAKLDNPTARSRLARGRQPHWQALARAVHLGWQRKPEAETGRWVLRRLIEGKYSQAPLGLADDTRSADGVAVLSHEQAKARALAALDEKPHGRITVRRAVAHYLDALKAQGRSTRDAEWRAAAHITPALGDIALADLTAERLRRWLAGLAAAPARVRTRAGEAQRFAPPADDPETLRRRRSTANRILKILKAALNFAHREGFVASAEEWGRRLPPFPSTEAARERHLSVEEARRLIAAASPDFRPLLRGALETGMRYGELARLLASDFNPAAGTVAVRKSKSGKPRQVIITPEGAAFFREIAARQPGDGLLFSRANGEPWRAGMQKRAMAAACARAGLAPLGFHIIRHTWASLAVMAGVPLLIVARNLGHASTAMIEKHYAHLAPSYVADAIREGAPRFG